MISNGSLTVAIQGCCHGELDTIYSTILEAEARDGVHVDLLLICGDFESVRVEGDLDSMAVPDKYKHMNSFRAYFLGEKVAPVLTVFVGGNHEASNVLQPLYYGGFVAPNIYYMGASGVVRFGTAQRSLRIGGITGIFKPEHFHWTHFEMPPYTESTKRSVYHFREFECWKLLHLGATARGDPCLDVLLSHDWPAGVWEYGDKAKLLRSKPFFREDIATGRLGAPPLMMLLRTLRPAFSFAAHLHTKFAAVHQQQGQQQGRAGADPDALDIDDL